MSTGSGEPPHALWRFSLDRYARNGVPPLCLSLQEEVGADVNLLLCALWLGSEGRLLSAGQAHALHAAAAPWHAEVVRPLRAVRRRLKGWEICPDAPREALRAQIQRQEIEAERLEQDMLFAVCATFEHPTADPRIAMAENLARVAAKAPKGPGDVATRAALAELCA
ncbi:MAG: TIGR02444 family protein [Roseovarius sp.]